MFKGRAWLELPTVIIIGLVIGLIFGQAVKLIPPQATVASQAKR